MKRIIESWAYSNLNISAGAAAYAFTTFAVFNIYPIDLKYIVFIFFATWSNYIFHRIFPVYYHQYKSHPNKIFQWTIKHLKLLSVFFMVSLLFSAILFFHLNNVAKLLLIALGGLTVAYSLPVFKSDYRIGKVRLRDLSYLKIILIAFTWAIICGNLVLVNSNYTFSIGQHISIFVEKFLFLIAITIPFDIRDYKQDKIELVKTIPNTIGVKQSILIATICLAISFLAIFLADINTCIKLAYLLAYIYATVLVLASVNKKNAMYFLLYLDGALILLGVLVFISTFLC